MSHSISYILQDTEKPNENVKNIVKDLEHFIPKTIKHFSPHFKQRLRKIEDHRKKPDYAIEEIIMGAISLFLFKLGSRNSINNYRSDEEFNQNYK